MNNPQLFLNAYFIVNLGGALWLSAKALWDERRGTRPKGTTDAEKMWNQATPATKAAILFFGFVVNLALFLPWVLIAKPLLAYNKRRK